MSDSFIDTYGVRVWGVGGGGGISGVELLEGGELLGERN